MHCSARPRPSPCDCGLSFIFMLTPTGLSLTTSNLLALLCRSVQSLHAIAYYCLAPRADHWLQLLPPRLSHEFGWEVDVALSRVFRACYTDAAYETELLRRRLRQPLRLKGVGLHASADSTDGISLKAHAGFIGSVSQALPRMLDRVTKDGVVLRGYSPGLRARVGDGSFDEAGGTRYQTLLDSGCALGQDIVTSWAALQHATQVGPGALPADALLSRPAHLLTFDKGTTDVQHCLTVEIENRRAVGLEPHTQDDRHDPQSQSQFGIRLFI